MFKVIVSFCFLSAFAGQAWAADVAESRVVMAKQDLRTFDAALVQYKNIHGAFPGTDEGLGALIEPRLNADSNDAEFPGILRKVPVDPWGNPYQYRNPGIYQAAPEVWSMGADGKAGGTGINTDFGNWPGSFDAYESEARFDARIRSLGLAATMLIVFTFWFTLPLIVSVGLRKHRTITLDARGLIKVVLYVLVVGPIAVVATMLALDPIAPGVY